MVRFAEAVAYAYRYWYQPCDDGKVYSRNGKVITIADEYKHFGKLDQTFLTDDWMPVFLRYNRAPRARAAYCRGAVSHTENRLRLGQACAA